jgi:hypothetical protein
MTWDDLVDPTRTALELLIAEGDRMTDRVEALEAKLAHALETLRVLADEENWFEVTREYGNVYHAWALYREEGTLYPIGMARDAIAVIEGDADEKAED